MAKKNAPQRAMKYQICKTVLWYLLTFSVIVPFLSWAGIASAQSSGVTLDLDNPAPPDTIATAQPDFDYLAWNMFVAMNWPAVVPTMANGYQRGFPDTTQTFIDTLGTDSKADVVWETFKEKREVFFYPAGNTDQPATWNSKVTYSSGESGRTFFQGSKLFNSLDETIEVASEALEEYYPDGTPNPVYGRPVAPRVWRGRPKADQSNAVRYEVKVNYDFYDYIFNYTDSNGDSKPLWLDANAFDVANSSPPIQLPLRTSAAPGGGANPNLNANYSAQTTYQAYQNRQPGDLPPKIGSVHIKAAWILLSPSEVASGRYLTARAQYFVTESDGTTIEAKTGTFGLVGLHIIQRIHTTSKAGGSLDTPGGAFIFAT